MLPCRATRVSWLAVLVWAAGLLPGHASFAVASVSDGRVLHAGMSAPALFSAQVQLPATTSPSVMIATLHLGRRLLSHRVKLATGSTGVTVTFNLAQAHVPRFTSPMPYRFCVRPTDDSPRCSVGVIPLPVAVIHGIFGDLAALSPEMDPYPPLLAALRRSGYADTGGYRTLTFVRYPSVTAFLGLVDHSLQKRLFGDGVTDYAARYLAPAVQGLLAESYAARVDLVGHSMGGLLARAYVRTPANAGRVRDVVMIGTPNLGSARTFMEVGSMANLPETARDLLPTYPYLYDEGQRGYLDPPVHNLFLSALNMRPFVAGVSITCIYEGSFPTTATLVVRGGVGPNRYQVLRSLDAIGDGTVTAQSAILPGASLYSLNDHIYHAQLPTDPHVQKIVLHVLLAAT